MAKIQAPKTLRFEDFKPEEKQLIDKLGEVINSFQDDVYRQFNGNIDIENLNRQIVKGLIVRTNASGELIGTPQIKLTTKSIPSGVTVIYAQNTKNPKIYPTSQPHPSFLIGNGLITITNITGLPPSSEYRLNLEIIV